MSVLKFVCLYMRALGVDVKQGSVCAHVRSYTYICLRWVGARVPDTCV